MKSSVRSYMPKWVTGAEPPGAGIVHATEGRRHDAPDLDCLVTGGCERRSWGT